MGRVRCIYSSDFDKYLKDYKGDGIVLTDKLGRREIQVMKAEGRSLCGAPEWLWVEGGRPEFPLRTEVQRGSWS